MNTVKSIVLSATLALVGISSASAQVFGTNLTVSNFGATAGTDDSWTYNPATSNLSGTEGLGFLLYGESFQTNYTGVTHLSLTANVLDLANAPLNGFTFLLQDGQEDTVTGVFNWAAFIGGATVTVPLVDISPAFDYNNIIGWNLVSGGSNAPLNVTFSNIRAVSVVPEPSTYATLAGLSILGFVACRRRRSA